MAWLPKRSLQQCETLLSAPGRIHEIETCLINGQLQKVYKNLWTNVRAFWIQQAELYSSKTYIVFEDQRYTYNDIHKRAVRTAAVFRHVYGITKGDRIGICSHNCPDYLVTFWACHLIGAVPVLTNAWLPLVPLEHCLSRTECKLIILDTDRADRLEEAVSRIVSTSAVSPIHFFVFDSHEGKRSWERMQCFRSVLDEYRGATEDILLEDPQIAPEDNALIMFTSGTTGLPKGVLSTQRQFLTNVLNLLVGGVRAAFRRGEDVPLQNSSPEGEPQKAMLIAVPLFHVTGTTSFAMMSTLIGAKIVLARKWIPEEAARLIKHEKITAAGGVPTMVSDLLESSLVGYPLEGMIYGGAPAPDTLVSRARSAFPSATMIQAYGLTETNSVAVSFAGEDYTARPASTGLPCPVNEVRIVRDGVQVPQGEVGEVWLRGPNVMKGYWRDPEATAKVITEDGWLRSGDLGYLDKEGFLYIKDRLKDIIIRGGENVDSVSVENALYQDHRLAEAAAVGVPDERLGELVAAVVCVRPAYQGLVTEAELISLARQSLPKFAVPVMIVIQNEPFEHTPSGKIIKGDLRKVARRHWEARRHNGTAHEPRANL